MKYRITYESVDGYRYSEIYDAALDYSEEHSLECGTWVQPFPNVEGNSQAFGLEEALAQSDECPEHFRESGIEKITVEELKG